MQTTIDADLQKAAFEAMENRAGAVIAMNPKTGEILAFVSAPSFDPNELSSHDPDAVRAAYTKYTDDPGKPLLNRPVAVTYPPGSTFKPVTALAALQEHVVDSGTLLPCTGSYTVKGETGQGQTFRNWDPNVNKPMADRKSTRLNSSHMSESRMPSSA